jgi:hypothetical protein
LPGGRRSCDKHQIVKSPLLWVVLIAALYALHQDLWFWRSARPLLAGFLPVGLTYHALYCVAASALMWGLTTWTWPSRLDAADAPLDRAPRRQSGAVRTGDARR